MSFHGRGSVIQHRMVRVLYWYSSIFQSPNFNHITSIKSFDFLTLYTTIPHQKLKSRLATIIRNSFINKNGNHRYKFLVLGREGPYFVKEHSDSKNKYTEDDIINMLEFLVKRKRRRSDPVLWQNPLYQQKIRKPKDNTQTPQKTSITNDCGPT